MKPEYTINTPMCILKGKNEVNCCECNQRYCDVVWELIVIYCDIVWGIDSYIL
jgi:hypothetical protein